MDNTMILPVILAGGSGERLWPLSRQAYPKQFLTLLGAEHSLFQATIQRLQAHSSFLAPLIVCHEEHRFIVAEQLRHINCISSGILLEPQAKNTAPAVAIAAQWAQSHFPGTLLLILPADHLLSDPALFMVNILNAARAAIQGALVTFGITITKPETGYGYIEAGLNNTVARFIEKPSLPLATEFAANPNFLWNSGMFMFSPAAYLAELATLRPDIANKTAFDISACKTDVDFIRPILPNYATCESSSIDYAIMEHTKNAKVFAINNPWSDIGSWQAVWEQSRKDTNGNALHGEVISHNSNNCLIDARSRLVAAVHVNNLAIIETSDAILIADQAHSQDIKVILAELKSRHHPAVTEHLRVNRPWGWYEVIATGPGFQVKLINVQPGKSLSLQTHQYRSEHWIIVTGTANVVRGNQTMMLQANESTFIPVGMMHQLSNQTQQILEIIEVQCGTYLGEDDIVRYADTHGRITVDIPAHA